MRKGKWEKIRETMAMEDRTMAPALLKMADEMRISFEECYQEWEWLTGSSRSQEPERHISQADIDRYKAFEKMYGVKWRCGRDHLANIDIQHDKLTGGPIRDVDARYKHISHQYHKHACEAYDLHWDEHESRQVFSIIQRSGWVNLIIDLLEDDQVDKSKALGILRDVIQGSFDGDDAFLCCIAYEDISARGKVDVASLEDARIARLEQSEGIIAIKDRMASTKKPIRRK